MKYCVCIDFWLFGANNVDESGLCKNDKNNHSSRKLKSDLLGKTNFSQSDELFLE